MLQTTLKSELRFEGIGIHTGQTARITMKPQPADCGLAFEVKGSRIPAQVDQVFDTKRGVALGHGATLVKTVEHCLSEIGRAHV